MSGKQLIGMTIGIFVTLILVAFKITETFPIAIAIGFSVMMVINYFVKQFSQSDKRNIKNKYTEEDYFNNEETKLWLDNQIKSFYENYSNFYSKAKEVSGSALDNYGTILHTFFSRGFGYGKNNKYEIEEAFYYKLVKSICMQRPEFQSDLDQITISINNFVCKGKTAFSYKDLDIDLEKLTAFILKKKPSVFTKKRNNKYLEELQIGIDHEELEELLKSIIEMKDEELNQIETSLKNFSKHYSNSF